MTKSDPTYPLKPVVIAIKEQLLIIYMGIQIKYFEQVENR
jgi:hypothetical protein